MQVIPANTAVVVIDYQSITWLPIALNSFFEHFSAPANLVIVDNNPDVNHELDAYADNYGAIIIRDLREALPTDSFCIDGRRSHGAAMDYAAEWLRAHNYEYMLHIEPDCFISGVAWWHELNSAINNNCAMSAIYAKPYGPLHPTPSLWRLKDISGSFRAQYRGADQQHPRYNELYNSNFVQNLEPGIREIIGGVNWYDIWVNPTTCIWDTAQKNWFDLAVIGRCAHTGSKRLDDAVAVLNSDTQFFHAWAGAQKSSDINLWPEFAAYSRIRAV
jgi:hypothetical protein